MVLVAVVAGVFMAVGAAFLATVDAFYLAGLLLRYADPGLPYEARAGLRTEVITALVKVLDVYLISAVLIVFSLGLYELFIRRIEAAEGSETASRLLYVTSLDDLKNKVAKLILLILTIEFFQRALKASYAGPLDLLYLAGSILLISGAFYLLGTDPSSDKASDPEDPDQDR